MRAGVLRLLPGRGTGTWVLLLAALASIGLACCGAERALDVMHYHAACGLLAAFVALLVLPLILYHRAKSALCLHVGLALVLSGWLVGLFFSPEEGTLRLRAGQTGSVNDEWQFTLDDFTIARWPDTGTVRQYTSYGHLEDSSAATIAVNHPLVKKGWWVYQNSYQELTNPHTGQPLYYTILLCVKDVGLPLVAAGGCLLLLGALLGIRRLQTTRALPKMQPLSPARGVVAAYALACVGAWAMVIHRGISTGHAPMQNMYEFLICTAAVLPLLTYSAQRRAASLRPLVVDAFLQALVLIPVAFFMDGRVKHLMPALQSPLFVPHVGAYVAGYVILVRAALGVGRNLIGVGFFLLTVGLVLGSLWGKVCWGHWWQFDPKEMWSLATWFVYAAYFHVRPRLSARAENAFLALGALLIVLTLTWINLSRVFTGMHSYA